MGLFTRHASPPPSAQLAIHLSPTTPSVLRPNDVLEGHISLTPSIPLSPHAVEVSLYGTSTVWLRTSTGAAAAGPGNPHQRRYLHYRDNAPLFCVSHNLLSSSTPATFSPGETYTLPFSLVVPAGTSNDRHHAYRDPSDTRWTAAPHHLPPTFAYGAPRGLDADGPDCARIEYGVRAQLVSPGAPNGAEPTPNVATAVPLFFSSLGRTGEPQQRLLAHSQVFTLQSSTLTGAAGGMRQSVRDRLSSRTPKVEFQVRVHVPGELVCGAEFRVGVDVELRERSGEDVRVPEMRVSVGKLELLDFTFVRAAKDRDAAASLSGTHARIFSSSSSPDDMPHPDTPYSGREHTVFTESKTRLNALPESVVLEPDENRDDKKGETHTPTTHASFTARIPGTTPPSFRSFAVTRAYRVRARVVVEVCGKEFEVDMESEVGALYSS